MITFTELLERAKSEKIAIHTPTEENANALLKALDRLGYEWCSWEKLTSRNNYKIYEENTCYAPLRKAYIEYCSLSFCGKVGYTIVEFADIDLEN